MNETQGPMATGGAGVSHLLKGCLPLIAVGVTAAIGIFAYYMMVKGKTCTSPKKRTLKGPVTLEDPNKKYPLELVEKINLTQDTRRYKFALPTKRHILGLPVGQHVYVSARIDGKLTVRPYTPVSSDDDQGYLELVFKVYFKDVNPRFPDGGKMSQYLNNLEIGQTLDFRGPSGHILYEGNGTFLIRPDKDKNTPYVRRCFQQIGLIAGGTGITPMLQLISDILKHADDPTIISLIFANQTKDDILLRDVLEDLRDRYPDRFHLWFTVDQNPGEDWNYSVGYVTAEIISEHLPVAGEEDTGIFICGPPPMITFACTPSLDKIGFPTKNRFFY